jgi:ERCC4-related helicase
MLEAFSLKYVKHPLIWPKTVEYRLYQKKIADVAYERNTLVILPTALGKTVISAIVAANVLYSTITGTPKSWLWLPLGPS